MSSVLKTSIPLLKKMKNILYLATENVTSGSDLTKIKRRFLFNIGQLDDVEAFGMDNAVNYYQSTTTKE